MEVPLIDVGPLFEPAQAARGAVDRAVMATAGEVGFMTLTGLPDGLAVDPGKRSRLLRIFDLPEADKRRLWRRRYDPDAPNVYRGWFPLEPDSITHKEGIDIGPDIAHADRPGQGHRTSDPGQRHAAPFDPVFFQPRVDAEIAPLPLAGVEPFAPFHYGDHVWAEMVKFVEFRGLEGCRAPSRTPCPGST